MKILLFIDWYLPGYKAGGPIQSCAAMVKNLSPDLEFLIVTRNTDYNESTPFPNIVPDAWNNLQKNVSVYYFSSDNLSKAGLKQLIRDTQFDLVFVNGIFSFYFSILPLWLIGNKRVFVSTRGMLSPNAISIKSIRKRVFLSIASIVGLYSKVSFIASDNVESVHVRKYFPQHSIHELSNFTREWIQKPLIKASKKKGELHLISIARISPEKNLKYALTCLSKVKGNITFELYGSVNDNEYWQACQEIIQSLPKNIKVIYKDAVKPEDIPSALSKGHFLFMPTLGENFGHIIYESMACGIPVIISDRTPWRNLKVANAGYDIPLNTESEFIATLEKCVEMSDVEYATLSTGALQMALSANQKTELRKKYLSLFVKD